MIGDKAYIALRSKLNSLHYSQPLSVDSCALVERLLGDLLATTELYQRVKVKVSEAEAQIEKEQIALVPLRKENARVVNENNSLHKEIIQAKESLSQNDNNWQKQYKQLESEYNDLKQAFSMKNYKIKELEKRNLKLEEKLNSAIAKSFKSDVKEVPSSLVPITDELGSRQHMEITYRLEKETNREIFTPEDENLLTQICAADERVQIINKELNMYKVYKDEAEVRIKELESMIQERDHEIDRLNNLYMGADKLDKMNIQFTEKENGDTIRKLNSQLDYVNKENNRLHQTIADLRIKNKGNTGMYHENKKVCDRIEILKKNNNDYRRRAEEAERIIVELKGRETDIMHAMRQEHIEKEKYDLALKTIELQQKDIERLKKYFEVKDNQEKIRTIEMIASQAPPKEEPKVTPTISPSDFAKLKAEKEKLAKKNEQFRNSIQFN